jgi:DNA-binding response OmpR family regulator
VNVLVLTTSPDPRSVLPGLELLPYSVDARGPSVHEFLAAGPCDAVLVDGRTHPYAACELSRRVVATDRGTPVVGVIEEMVAPEIDADCAVVQLVLSGAGPAEIDARLRLVQRHRRPSPASSQSVLRVGPFEVDAHTYSASVAGTPLALTHHEFELLRMLLVHAGRVLTREQLLAGSDAWAEDAGPRTVDCHVRAVRAKLGAYRDRIRTVRGKGYTVLWAPPSPVSRGPVSRGASVRC